MILLNFMPEIVISATLMGSLFLSAFFSESRVPVSPWVAVLAFFGLAYVMGRPDLSFFASADHMILSDSISFFLRSLSLLALGGFSTSISFHQGLSLRDKQRATLFVQFFSVFACGLALSQNLVAFLVSALGMLFASYNITLIESAGSQAWIKLFRMKAVWLGVWSLLIAVLFVLSAFLLQTTDLSAWSSALHSMSALGWANAALVVLVVLCGLMPLVSAIFVGRAPFGLAVVSFGLLLINITFWVRVGVPVLGSYSSEGTIETRSLIGAAISIITLRSCIRALLTREHHEWLSFVYPALNGLVILSILLPGAQAVPSIFVLSIGTLLTFILASHAFIETEYRNKTLIVFSLISISGAPPLVMGERYYQMIFELLNASNAVAAIGVALSWLMILLASTQIIGKILRIRVSKENQRAFTSAEAFIMAIYLIGVIALSSLRPQLVAFLNRHPPLNLW